MDDEFDGKACDGAAGRYGAGELYEGSGVKDRAGIWRWPRQPHPGTRIGSYRCSLPGLAGFTAYRCEGTDGTTMTHSGVAPLKVAYCEEKAPTLQAPISSAENP